MAGTLIPGSGSSKPLYLISALIPNGASSSDLITLGSRRLLQIIPPASLVGTTITLLESIDGVNADQMGSLYDGTEITYTIAPGKKFPIPNLAVIMGLCAFKIQTGTTASPVIQTADATFQLMVGSI